MLEEIVEVMRTNLILVMMNSKCGNDVNNTILLPFQSNYNEDSTDVDRKQEKQVASYRYS